MLKGAVVVVSCNRRVELLRLLGQLSESFFSGEIDLFVSIDKSEDQEDIFKSVSDFPWSFGGKEIIKREWRMGLKDHVLACGDIVDGYDYIVMLEEDLVVSQYALGYAHEAVDFYSRQSEVAGISLYSYERRESDKQRFRPVDDGKDTFFMQFCSSWGQVWTRSMWLEFRSWLHGNDCDSFRDDLVPSYISDWPKSSWKKHFIRYMIHNNKYFAFPRVGLSTNPGVDGTHHSGIYGLYFSSIVFGKKIWDFQAFSDARFFYDASFLLSAIDGFLSYEDCQEFSAGRSLGGAKMFFLSSPLRSDFYFKVFILAVFNDLKKLIRRVFR